ncbi:MAG: GWxTD domain-containing protein [Saprospiraceae bacterium]
MKKSILSLIYVAVLSTASKALDANISYGIFKSNEGPYIEVYLHVVGQTVAFIPATDSTVFANMEVVILFKQAEDVVKFDKYKLTSPSYPSPQDFFDIKRYSLPAGEYDLEVSVNDLNREGNTKRYNKPFKIDFIENRVYQSDIQLIASLRKIKEDQAENIMAKGGYIFEPLPSQFYDKYCDRLIFYNEIYDTDKLIGDDFMVSYFMEATSGEKKSMAIGAVHKRRSPGAVVPFLQQMDISELKSGNYNLVMEVKNKTGELLTKKSISFQRSNPYFKATREEIAASTDNLDDEFVAKMTVEELRYSLRAIAMQVDDVDGELLNTIIAEAKPKAMRLYLFSFWAKEDPVNPERAYNGYMAVAKAIDKKFENGFGYGFESDRGYVYMKYGVPSDVVSVESEQSAPPYEIWFYNQFPQTGQSNVKFLFYNPTLSTNGHTLLHSTARGEVNNPSWEVQLYSDAPNGGQSGNFIDDLKAPTGTDRNARRLFESY